MSIYASDGASTEPIIRFRVTLPATLVFTVFMLVIYLLGVKAVTYDEVRAIEGTTAVTEVEPGSDVVSSRQQIATLLANP